jgi:type IV pilus assembly protein PilN
MLRGQIKQLDKQIEEINSLESAKQKFIARMEIIEKLQRSRPEIVHLFDEIVRQLPEGVYLTSVKQQDKRLKFDGVAQSSTRVSTFMRNIDSSEWMQHSELEVIETKGGGGVQGGSAFTVFADQVSNAGQDDGKGGKGAPGAGKKLASRGAP